MLRRFGNISISEIKNQMANKVLNVLVSVQDEFSKGLNKFSDGLKNNEKNFKTMAKVGTATFTAVAGGLFLATNSYAKAGDEIAKLSTKTGFSTVALSELKHAAELSGTSLGGLEKGFFSMSKFMEMANYGGARQARTLDKIGLEIKDLQGLSPESTFEKLSMAVADVDDPMQKLTIASELFGNAGKDMLPMLSGGSEGLKKMREEVHKLGTVFDEDAAKAAELYNDNMLRMNKAFEGVRNQIAIAFLPILTNLFSKIQLVAVKVREWAEMNPKIIPGILTAVLVISGLVAVVGTLGLLLPMIISGFAMLASPIGLAVVAIGLLTAALTYFYVTNETFRNIVNAVWDEVKIKIETVVSAIRAFWQTHGTAIMNSAMLVWDTIRDVVSTAMWIIQEAISLGIQAIRWIWEEFGEYIQFVTSTVWEFITLFIGGAINNVKIVLNTVLALIRGDWEGVWNGIKNILSNLWETMKGIVGLGISTMVSFITGSGIASAFGGAWEAAKGAMMAVIETIKGAVQGLMDWISDKVQAIMGVLRGAVNTVKSLGSGAVNLAKRAVGVNDAIISPKGDIITTHPDDYLIATKDPHSLAGKGGITVNISGNTLLDSRGAEKIGELLMKELRRNVIPA